MNGPLTIEPYTSIGPLSLGICEKACIEILGLPPDQFKRFKEGPEVIFAYDEEHLHVEFCPNKTVPLWSG